MCYTPPAMLKIGPVQLDIPVVQAALSGYSDVPMCLLARRFGAPYAVHEVMLDEFVIHPGKYQRKLLAIPDEDHPVGGQLMGAEPRVFAQAAVLLAEAGYDVIDINFGCPVRKVLGRHRGGHLLSTPDTAIEIMRCVRGAVPGHIAVTLKLRRGTDDSPASERNFFKILDTAFDTGLAAVTVHGRTVKQRYVGPSDWGFLKRVKQHVGNRTILGSGDLFIAADIMRMLEETGVDGVTVARGCIGNPWIFRDVRALLAGEPLPEPPGVAEQGRLIREHFLLAEQFHGKTALKVMRRFGIRYSELHPMARRVRDAFVNVRFTREDWLAVLDEWYDPQREWPAPRRKTGPGKLVATGARE